MRRVPTRTAEPRDPRRMIIGPHTPEFSAYGAINLQFTIVSGTWQSINDPVAMPFRLSRGVIVDRLGWVNGSSAGGTIDVGIYDAAWNRLVSTTATGGSGNSLPQWVDVTDTYIPPNGTHYLAIVLNNTTANRLRYWQLVTASLQAAELAGMLDSTTNGTPLPDPLTNMGAPSFVTFVPHALIACRAAF